jgi:excisionase family DNA binding protein
VNDERETPTPNRLVYTPREVADLLCVDRSTVYRRIRDGSIPIVKMGTGKMFIPKKPFDEMFSGATTAGDVRGAG